MRKENKKMLAVVLFAVCVLTAAGMDGSISVASTETRQTDSIEKTQTISSALASALEQIPEVAAVAVSTQEWHQKAVSNVDGETDVLLAGEEGSEVVGKLYHNTIVDVEEKGVVWTRVSADEVNGYVKSDSLAFGTDAVRRADQVCPVVEKPMEDNGAMYAIGHILDCRQNTQGGIIFECEKIAITNIDDYNEYWVYQMSLNPTILYLPENIYANIEDQLLKNTTLEESSNKTQVEEKVEKELGEIGKNIRVDNEGIIEIDTTEKNDELIITSMDYHSQKRKDPLFYNMKDFVNIHTALKCNSLVILSGLSGTGKSAIVDIYAKALGINTNANNPDENRLLFIPVRPSWNDDSDLLGYVDLVHMVYRASDSGFVDFLVRAQKDENKNKIFIVCFDEMNLARVEHYFSKFLSLLEQPVKNRELQLYDKQYSGRLYNSADYPCKITIGDNVKFVGTVNVDESTYHFSDKVLDRANVIQLDVLNYAKEWEKKKYGSLVNANWSMDDYNSIIITSSDQDMGRVHQLLWDIHTLLHSVSSKYGVGPRIVKNIDMYLWNLPKSNIGEFTFAIGIDLQIAQRVLTKVRGPENQLGEILSDKSSRNIYQVFDEYQDLSEFKLCREIVVQKQRELESYGYCI